MKRIISLSLIIFFLWQIHEVSAQTGIITTDGINVPRITTASRDAIATPANGQLIYNTDDNCFNVYQNGTWQKLCGFDTPPSDTWTKKADFGGTPRSYAAGFSIGNKGYIGVGGNNTDFWEYDPTTNAWTQKANFGGTVNESAGGFSIGSKGYIATDATDGNNFYEFDPNANTWTKKTFAPFYPFSAGFSIGVKGMSEEGVHCLHYMKAVAFMNMTLILISGQKKQIQAPISEVLVFRLATKVI